MIYAILNNDCNTVENIAESYIALHKNWIQVPIGLCVSIGDTFDNGTFYRDGNELITEEQRLRRTLDALLGNEEE